MLKNKPDLLISDEETRLLDKINSDNSTGHHLLARREEAYWNMRKEIAEAEDLKAKGAALSGRQEQILEYLRQGEDYSYWKSLPEEKKLFVETEA